MVHRSELARRLVHRSGTLVLERVPDTNPDYRTPGAKLALRFGTGFFTAALKAVRARPASQ